MEKSLKLIIHYSLFIIIFLFPFFFLPFTQEFFITNKLYLLAFGGLLLFLSSVFSLLFSKKLVWSSHPFDRPLAFFLLTIGLSILIASPNKVQAILNPNFGLVGIISLVILYFYLRSALNKGQTLLEKVLAVSSLVLSLITIIFFFQPLKNVNLPTYLQFLKNPIFTPLGSQLDLAIFLGFFVVYSLSHVIASDPPAGGERGNDTKTVIFNFSLLTFNLLALSLTLYSLLARRSFGEGGSLQLPPFRLSWYAAVETLKNPLTALFGVGVDNFSSLFTRVKDFAYNQSPLWQINSFSVSRSAILHIFTETGIFGIVAFGLLLLVAAKSLFVNKINLGLFAYLLICLLIFPPSLPVFFLLFVFLSVIASEAKQSHEIATGSSSPRNDTVVDLSNLLPIYLGTAIVCLLLIAGAGYFLGRSFAAEYFFKKSLDGIVQNDVKQVYDNMRQAIILNPYLERFRLNFSQVNLMIANNVATKKDLTDQDRQTIAQAIQASIAEAKVAAALNPQKAGNWENLAVIYRNIINAVQGADVWAISAYQRAIVADPQNPTYRLNLGGTYYSLGNYEESLKIFEQSVALKPDWPNAHYNLAWADFQRGNYKRAAGGMQNVLTLLNPQKDKADYDRAQKDLEEFKKKLPKEEAGATPSGQPSQLTLPTPPAATLEPKIRLPKEASPEAK